MTRLFGRQKPAFLGSWTIKYLLSWITLWLMGVVAGVLAWFGYDRDSDPWGVAFFVFVALFLFLTPVLGLTLSNRPEEIRCPQHVTRAGRPALRFPADERAVPGSAALYALYSAALLCLGLAGEEGFRGGGFLFAFPSAFFATYTLFAVLGRFHDDGTYLTEQGVTIRSRGLRAEIPWSSIEGSHTYRTWPFPLDRIAIRLYPGRPREVSITVPWWIGSPRPRNNMVFLTEVQVPGFDPMDSETDPSLWIDKFAENPPSASDLQQADVTPSQTRRADFVTSLHRRAAAQDPSLKHVRGKRFTWRRGRHRASMWTF